MKAIIAATVGFALAGAALAASPFDGMWKIDVGSAKFPTKPTVLLLKDGTYTCSSCNPVFTTSADGGFHAITGHPGIDEAQVKIVDAATITESEKLKGKLLYTSTYKISADGQTRTEAWVDYSAPDGKPMTGTGISKRVAPVPAGAHAISGSWQADKVAAVSDSSVMMKIKVDGKAVGIWSPNGFGYDTTVGAPPVPFKGDLSNIMVSVEMPKPNTLVETDTRDGKPLGTMTMVVAADDKTIDVSSYSALQGTTTTYKMLKQ